MTGLYLTVVFDTLVWSPHEDVVLELEAVVGDVGLVVEDAVLHLLGLDGQPGGVARALGVGHHQDQVGVGDQGNRERPGIIIIIIVISYIIIVIVIILVPTSCTCCRGSS